MFCDSFKTENTFLPYYLPCRMAEKNLISSIWNESNLILLDQKSVSIVLKHAITPRYSAIVAKVAQCYHRGKYTLIEKTVQDGFWKIKWPFLVHNLVRQLIKSHPDGLYYTQGLKEDALSNLQKWVKGYSPRIRISYHLNF